MSTSVETSHKSILKTTGVFGLVQVVKIVLAIFSVKIVALYLGVTGVGKLGYLQSILNIVTAICNFGLQTILVREISLLKGKENFDRNINLLHNWSLYVGIFGFLVFLGAIPFVDDTILDDFSFFWSVLLAFQFVFSALGNFKTCYLQGSQQVRKFALVQVLNSLVITLLSIVLYFLFGIKAIVFVLFLNSLLGYLIPSFFTQEIPFFSKFISIKATFRETKHLLKTGFLLSVNGIFGYICTFFTKYYLKECHNGIEIIGFYDVALTIMISYVGLVFTSMASDFYPKLTSIVKLKKESHSLINNQIQIALLLVLPIVIGVLSFDSFFISLFYTKQFLSVIMILEVGLFSVIIKAVSWPLSFYLLALKDNRRYFFLELIADFLNVTLSILFYKFFGLQGLGLAMGLNFLLYAIFISYLLIAKYGFIYEKATLAMIFICFSFYAIALVFRLIEYEFNLIISILWFVMICFYSLYQIDKKVNLKQILVKIKSKF
ncbi:MAG: oligosaccharide flippase family protein [Limnohabitans sp.]|nr:oligosaccharide flippase family protein [Limnohabitans sp.]